MTPSRARNLSRWIASFVSRWIASFVSRWIAPFVSRWIAPYRVVRWPVSAILSLGAAAMLAALLDQAFISAISKESERARNASARSLHALAQDYFSTKLKAAEGDAFKAAAGAALADALCHEQYQVNAFLENSETKERIYRYDSGPSWHVHSKVPIVSTAGEPLAELVLLTKASEETPFLRLLLATPHRLLMALLKDDDLPDQGHRTFLFSLALGMVVLTVILTPLISGQILLMKARKELEQANELASKASEDLEMAKAATEAAREGSRKLEERLKEARAQMTEDKNKIENLEKALEGENRKVADREKAQEDLTNEWVKAQEGKERAEAEVQRLTKARPASPSSWVDSLTKDAVSDKGKDPQLKVPDHGSGSRQATERAYDAIPRELKTKFTRATGGPFQSAKEIKVCKSEKEWYLVIGVGDLAREGSKPHACLQLYYEPRGDWTGSVAGVILALELREKCKQMRDHKIRVQGT